MITPVQAVTAAPHFRAKEAGVTLLVALCAVIFADYFLQIFLSYLQELNGTFSLQNRTELEIRALRSAVLGVINPVAILSVSLLMLKWYLPHDSTRSLCKKFGLAERPSAQLLVASFSCGAIYVAAFIGLRLLFPPSELVTPHPDNVINYASLGEKMLFAGTAITLVPIAEEIFFRGILYQGIANSWGKLFSAICVSLIFISLHPGSIGSGYWVTHLALYIFPFLMVVLREAARTLYAPVAAHSGFNFAEIFF